MKENDDFPNQIYNPYTGKMEDTDENSKTKQKTILENGNNYNNLYNTNNNNDKDSNFIDLSVSQIISSKKDNFSINNEKTKNDLQTSTEVKKSHHHHKKKLTVNLTEEEEIYFYNLFESLDLNNINKLDSVVASTFFKKSGLPKHVLKEIWLMVVRYSTSYITREEFYIILRLIALAQNNMPYKEENIRTNSPIPPLPSFKYKIKMSNRIIYKISENNKKAYKRLFENSKDNKNDIDIISRKAINIWKSTNASDDFIRKIASIITPLEKKGHFNLKEFQVANYLFAISDKYEIPDKLPLSLFNYLGRGEKNENNNMNNNIEGGNINKNAIDKKKVEECNEFIKEALKKAKELNKENDVINEKINESKNKIKNLIKNIQNLEKEQDIIKGKLNYLYNGCSELIELLEKNKNLISTNNINNEKAEINNNKNEHNNSINFNDNNMVGNDNENENNKNIIMDNINNNNNNNIDNINNVIQNNENQEKKQNNNEINIPKRENIKININLKEKDNEINNGQTNNNINNFMSINQDKNEKNDKIINIKIKV